jgi:hypothetical protein
MGPPNDASVGVLLALLASAAAYGWGTAEAAAYHRRLQRRLALGLADPMVVARFRLWAISGGCALAAVISSGFFLFALGRPIASEPAAFVALQLALFIAAVALWLAFFPPAFYRRRLSSRAGG